MTKNTSPSNPLYSPGDIFLVKKEYTDGDSWKVYFILEIEKRRAYHYKFIVIAFDWLVGKRAALLREASENKFQEALNNGELVEKDLKFLVLHGHPATVIKRCLDRGRLLQSYCDKLESAEERVVAYRSKIELLEKAEDILRSRYEDNTSESDE